MAGFDPALLNRVRRCPVMPGVAVTVVVLGTGSSLLPSGSLPEALWAVGLMSQGGEGGGGCV
jgi:hypothetical protein